MADERPAVTPDANEICREVKEVFRGLVDKNALQDSKYVFLRIKEAVNYCFTNETVSEEIARRRNELINFSREYRKRPRCRDSINVWQTLVTVADAVYAEAEAIASRHAKVGADAQAAEQADLEDSSEDNTLEQALAFFERGGGTPHLQQPAIDTSPAQSFIQFAPQHEAATAQGSNQPAARPAALRELIGTHDAAKLYRYVYDILERRSLQDDRVVEGGVKISELQFNLVSHAIDTVCTYRTYDHCPQEMVKFSMQLDAFGDDYLALGEDEPTDDLWIRLQSIALEVTQ